MNSFCNNYGNSYFNPAPMGYDGNPVTRTKISHPYSYDPFLVYLKDAKYLKDAPNGFIQIVCGNGTARNIIVAAGKFGIMRGNVLVDDLTNQLSNSYSCITITLNLNW